MPVSLDDFEINHSGWQLTSLVTAHNMQLLLVMLWFSIPQLQKCTLQPEYMPTDFKSQNSILFAFEKTSFCIIEALQYVPF